MYNCTDEVGLNVAVDTSVILAVLTTEPERGKIVGLTENADLLAPSSVHWEVGNALSAMLKRRRLTADQVREVLAAYERIPIRFVDVDLADSLRIAAESNLYAYDAYVIACARDQRCALISLDRGLLAAARREGVGIIEVGGT